MKGLIKGILKQLLTGIDGESYDIHRVCILGGSIILGGAVIFSLWRVEKVILTEVGTMLNDFGIALGSLLGGGGIGIMAKAKTEPQ